MVEKLEGRYEPKDQKPVHQAVLKCRKRKTGESLPELMADIKRLIRRAYPTADAAISDELTVKHFKDALNNEAMEWAVHEIRDTSTDAALAAAMNYEAFHAGRGKIKDSEKTTMQDWKVIIPEIKKIILDDRKKGDKPRSDRRSESDKKPGSDGRQSPRRRRDYTDYQCYNCGTYGHIKSMCPLKPTEEDGKGTDQQTSTQGQAIPGNQGNGSSLGN